MSTASPQPFSDTMTMLWRNILHNLRAPSGVITVIGIPLIFLLLFVYVFGETLGAGLMTGGTRDEYLAYITPAILLMAAASATQMIAVWISMDMSQGIIARFRAMAIARSSVLAGHVYGGTILITLSIAALLGFALLLGYRPQADALDWLALAGLVVLVGFALAWLSVAFGLAAKRPDTASNVPLLLMILPLLSGGFVPISRSPAGCKASPNTSRSRPSSAPSAASSTAPPRDAMRHGPSFGPSRSPSPATSARCGSTAATPRRP